MVGRVILIEIAIFGAVVRVQCVMNYTVRCLFVFRNVGGSSSLYTWRGIPSSSSLCVVPYFHSMLFSCHFTTSVLTSLLLPRLYSTAGHVLHIIPVVSGEFSVSSCISCLLMYF